MTLPSAPLIAMVEARGGIGAALTARGLPPRLRAKFSRAYHRAKSSGTVSLQQADRLCVVVLGKHPCEVWGAEWFVPVPA